MRGRCVTAYVTDVTKTVKLVIGYLTDIAMCMACVTGYIPVVTGDITVFKKCTVIAPLSTFKPPLSLTFNSQSNYILNKHAVGFKI